MNATVRTLSLVACFAALTTAPYAGAAEKKDSLLKEAVLPAPMPPGVRVESTALHGSVFADVDGKTLYVWPSKGMRNGVAGEDKGKIICEDVHIEESAGLMSIYPAGLELPDLGIRPTCAQVWPAFTAPSDAKAIGKWTILTRKDGAKQWAYDGQAVYKSSLDHQPGDVLGAVMRPTQRDDTAPRNPIGPPVDLAPGFSVETTYMGRMLLGPKGMSVYAFDRDSAGKSTCTGSCLDEFVPVPAPSFFKGRGEWGEIERSAGIHQISYRGKPLYTHPGDHEIHSQEGSDVPGWHNVYTQLAPALPAGFSIQDMTYGQIIAGPGGKTVYYYSCDEDALDQLSCDHPGTTQVYRLAICGNGDPKVCQQKWPLVQAAANAKGDGRIWSVITIDPMTGRFAAAGQAGALRVWAYRGRPIYTYEGDHAAGEIWGNGLGELIGKHNGFKAFIVRND